MKVYKTKYKTNGALEIIKQEREPSFPEFKIGDTYNYQVFYPDMSVRDISEQISSIEQWVEDVDEYTELFVLGKE
jgi:hypothetical protein